MGDRDRPLSPPELKDGLEAIVMPRERPVVFVRRSGIDPLPDPWTHLNKDPLRQSLLALAPSIGRVELPNSTQYPYGGTGFVVSRPADDQPPRRRPLRHRPGVPRHPLCGGRRRGELRSVKARGGRPARGSGGGPPGP